jgi:hypothetical protein
MNRILTNLSKINDSQQKQLRIMITIITIIRRGGIEKTNEGVNKGRERKRKESKTQESCFDAAEGKKFSSSPKYLTGYRAPLPGSH